ncbi:MAG: hypothetical protein Kow0068_19340 [Marinilabiliales bacterium]
MKIFAVIFFLSLIFILSAQNDNVKIYGKSEKYALDSLIFYTYDDYITEKTVEIARTQVDSNGYFNLSFHIKNTLLSYVNLGKYRGLLYLEPGRNYNLKLPEKKEKTLVDSLNVFFQPVDLYMGIYNSDSSELNLLVKLFDPYYDNYIAEHFLEIHKKAYNSRVDTFINKTTKMFSFAKNKYFQNYMYYKFAHLKFMAYERDFMTVTKKYLKDKPILLNNNAYMAFFNEVFKNFIAVYSTHKDGKDIYSDIALAKSPYRIKKSFNMNVSLQNDSLQDLIILKGIHDSFYNNPFGYNKPLPAKQLFQVLDSMMILMKNPEFVKIAKNIKEKVTGNTVRDFDTAYNFSLNDINENIDQLINHKGKYVYLCFYSFYNYSCRQDLFILDNLQNKYKDYLDIVVIFCDGKKNEIKDFINTNNLKAQYLLLNNNEQVVKEYKVKILPAYYLINPEGLFVGHPVPGPEEKFSQIFNSILRNTRN